MHEIWQFLAAAAATTTTLAEAFSPETSGIVDKTTSRQIIRLLNSKLI